MSATIVLPDAMGTVAIASGQLHKANLFFE
jgi:hypothetical protein